MSPIPSRLSPPNGADGTIRLRLPSPPSMNRLWRVTRLGKVYKDPDVVKYQKQVQAYVLASRVVMFEHGDLTVSLTWHRARKAGDVDNRLKVLLDAFTGLCYRDDAQVKRIVIERRDGEQAAGVDVRIKPYQWGNDDERLGA